MTQLPVDIMATLVAGSHAYGTNNMHSDVDKRGIFVPRLSEIISLVPVKEQIEISGEDTVYYSLPRFMQLATGANPNIIELLFPPHDTIEYADERFDLLTQNAHLFVSKRVANTFIGYAKSQIHRASGVNKWINNPQPETPPNMRNFFKVIPLSLEEVSSEADVPYAVNWILVPENSGPPMRPLNYEPYEKYEGHMKLAKVEGTSNVYRMYFHQDWRTGGFVKNNSLALSPVSKKEESCFAGLLIYNETGFAEAKKKHKEYWQWAGERNESRYVTEDGIALEYDAKNMMHCVRILLSGTSLLQRGHPIVRFDGENLDILLSIRAGRQSYQHLVEFAESQIKVIDNLLEKSPLPDEPNMEKINILYKKIMKMSQR
jgi:hypothetical protein